MKNIIFTTIFTLALCFAGLTDIKIAEASIFPDGVQISANAADEEPETGNDGYFQGGWKNGSSIPEKGTINMNGLSGAGGLTQGSLALGDRLHFGKAGTIGDGGATHLGWRVLGIGPIAAEQRIPDNKYAQSQSTALEANQALIASEDQDGISERFATEGNRNAFDWYGQRNQIGITSDNFAQNNFYEFENNAFVIAPINGVCSIAWNGCAGGADQQDGLGTSTRSYKTFPPSALDIDGKYFSSLDGKKVKTLKGQTQG
jgi:hypothetical protein